MAGEFHFKAFVLIQIVHCERFGIERRHWLRTGPGYAHIRIGPYEMRTWGWPKRS